MTEIGKGKRMTQQVLKTEPQNEMHDTGIDKNEWISNAVTEVLCDSVLLMIKTQGYHWNVVGPLFVPIHELTERLYRDLFEAIDGCCQTDSNQSQFSTNRRNLGDAKLAPLG